MDEELSRGGGREGFRLRDGIGRGGAVHPGLSRVAVRTESALVKPDIQPDHWALAELSSLRSKAGKRPDGKQGADSRLPVPVHSRKPPRGDDLNGGVRVGSKGQDVQKSKPVALSEPDNFQAGHWATIVETITSDPTAGVRTSPSVLSVTNDLEGLTPKALQVVHELLELPLDMNDENFVQVARVKLEAAKLSLGTQLKVDENWLKKEKTDKIFTILQELKDEENRMGVLHLQAIE